MGNKNNREGDNVIQLFSGKTEPNSAANGHGGYAESADELFLASAPACRLGDEDLYGMHVKQERIFPHKQWSEAVNKFRRKFKEWSATATDDDLWRCLSLVDADKLAKLGDTPEEIVEKLRIALDIILGDIIGSGSLAKFMKLSGVTPYDLMTAFDDGNTASV